MQHHALLKAPKQHAMRVILTSSMVVTAPTFQALISSLNEYPFMKACCMSVTVEVSQSVISPYVVVSPLTQSVHAVLKLALVIAVAASPLVSAKSMTQMDKRLLLLRSVMVVDDDDDG
jgi:hypothetical protein